MLWELRNKDAELIHPDSISNYMFLGQIKETKNYHLGCDYRELIALRNATTEEPAWLVYCGVGGTSAYLFEEVEDVINFWNRLTFGEDCINKEMFNG